MSDLPLQIDIFSLFPDMFSGPFSESILKRATARNLAVITVHDIRAWTTDRHHTADDTPYGGGAGMVLKVDPIVAAVESVLGIDLPDTDILIMAAGGHVFDQTAAHQLANSRRVAIICGHYEGIDERVADILNARQVSIGDFVLTGGELPAMVIADAIVRLVPGVIDNASIADESHSIVGDGLVEYPQYTRPREFRGHAVPDILLSGHHGDIARWRQEQARMRTESWRPDLLDKSQN
ncbi:MAG: tRNA (guanosine(37)-N1)-methyltransferase TrmD [Thermomicrobiales bacterium]